MLTAALVLSVFAAIPPVKVSAAKAEFNAVEEPFPEDNLLAGTSFDEGNLACVKMNKYMELVETDTGNYLQISRFTVNTIGMSFTWNKKPILQGTYKFTAYFRMMYEDEVTDLRINIYDFEGKQLQETVLVSPTDDEWMKVEYYFEIPENGMFGSIFINGWMDARYIQPYCVDNLSIVKVDEIPEGYKLQKQWGTYVNPANAEKSQTDSLVLWEPWQRDYETQFDVNGIILNLDADAFIGGVGGKSAVQQYVRGYADTQVTDFMICLNNTNSTFPSALDTWTDLADKYLQKEENGRPVDYSKASNAKAAYDHFIRSGEDYIKVMCETFPEIGINPWISFRMNDIHDHGQQTSVLLSDYYHNNPQYRRMAPHGSGGWASGYAMYALDWMHEPVRQRFLDYINEALSRYNCYGIELDFQREIYLWSIGNEYNGLDILNDFMRDVESIVEVYEQKYGHEIKIGIRCASDVETNYDFGLDVLTWAAEGIIDLVIPTGHYTTTDTDTPVTEWVSLMHPYGIEVAPCIEEYISSNPGGGRTQNNLKTYNGAAASFLSQGADKVAVYNFYISCGQYIRDMHKVSTTAEDVSGTFRHFNIASTIGSLEKLMTLDRRVVLTYNDTKMIWDDNRAQLPLTIKAGETGTLRIAVGDIPAGATVTLKFSVNAQNIAKRPTVYVNSKTATWLGLEINEEGLSKSQVITYSVPASALTSQHLVVEIAPQRDLTCDYAEVLIEVAK